MPNQIPLDPVLPPEFDNTDNEARSKEELDAWWDHPFGRTREDGKIEVRCLNGGAWDRSTFLGIADTYNDACALADEKQREWVELRGKPASLLDQPPRLVIPPQRPDHPWTTLKTFASTEEMQAYLTAQRSSPSTPS